MQGIVVLGQGAHWGFSVLITPARLPILKGIVSTKHVRKSSEFIILGVVWENVQALYLILLFLSFYFFEMILEFSVSQTDVYETILVLFLNPLS
jgi:hypothetical protein